MQIFSEGLTLTPIHFKPAFLLRMPPLLAASTIVVGWSWTLQKISESSSLRTRSEIVMTLASFLILSRSATQKIPLDSDLILVQLSDRRADLPGLHLSQRVQGGLQHWDPKPLFQM
jgi:hypothetical protein